MRAISSDHSTLTSNHNRDGVVLDCLEKSILASRRPRSSSVTSFSTADTCNSSVFSSTRSLTISTLHAVSKVRNRRVHFDSKVEEYLPTHRLPVAVEELWYIQRDYKLFRNIAQKEGIRYRLKSGVVEDLQAVYEVHGNLFQAPLSRSEHRTQSGPTRNYKESMSLDLAVQIIGSDFRGLELVIVKKMSADRKAVLKGIVDMQTKLPDGLSANERAIAIAAKARFFTRQFRQFAQIQGRADLLRASEIHAEEELGESR